MSEIDKYLNAKTRSELITKSPGTEANMKLLKTVRRIFQLLFLEPFAELLQLAMEINKKPTASLVSAAVTSDFQSEIVPQYQSADFILHNFRWITSLSEAWLIAKRNSLETNGGKHLSVPCNIRRIQSIPCH